MTLQFSQRPFSSYAEILLRETFFIALGLVCVSVSASCASAGILVASFNNDTIQQYDNSGKSRFATEGGLKESGADSRRNVALTR